MQSMSYRYKRPLMKYLCLLLLLLSMGPASWGQSFEEFVNPPKMYRPYVRWWWNGNKVDSAEIVRELKVLDEAHIGGVEINPVCFPPFADSLGIRSLEWLSDEWIDMLKVAFDKAKELGLTCDLIVGSGWPYGGEWLKEEERAQVLLTYAQPVKGPCRLKINRDSIARSVDPKVTIPNPLRSYEVESVKLVPNPMNSIKEAVEIEGDEIDVPQGDYYLYALVKYRSFASVIEGAPGASGSILDHLNAQAVDDYLYRMSRTIEQRIGPLKNYVRAMFTDSMELEGCNWTDDFAKEFLLRNGYDIEPYLPFIMFKVGRLGEVESYRFGAEKGAKFAEELNRVRYDFEKTKADLLRERFSKRYAQWCRNIGVYSRAQSYGRGFYPESTSLCYDIPEGESWTTNYLRHRPGFEMPDNDYRRGRAYTMINKYVSSAAAYQLNRWVSCEEMTNTYDVFNASLEQLKQGSDMSIQSGITHSVWHGFNYSPLEAPFPGWLTYGNYLSERNTWWPYFHLLNDYKASLSYFLMHADPLYDVAILPPTADIWSRYGVQTEPFPQKNVDCVSLLWEAASQNGANAMYVDEEMLTGDGLKTWDVLLLPQVESISPATMEQILKEMKNGCKVVCINTVPCKSVGLKDRKTNDARVKRLVAKARRKYAHLFFEVQAPDDKNFIEWYRRLQDSLSLTHSVTIENPDRFVMQKSFVCDRGAWACFISNIHREESRRVDIQFSAEKGFVPVVWDAARGNRYRLAPLDGKYSLLLDPAESLLIVMERQKDAEDYPLFEKAFNKDADTLSGFQVKHNETVTMDSLVPLPDDFAGTAEYVVRVPSAKRFLDLGKVNGISEVMVCEEGGESEPVLCGKPQWFGRHLYQIPDSLHGKTVVLKIKVVTTLGNKLQGYKDNKAVMKWFTGRKQQPFYPQGLLGPVLVYD